MNLVSIQRTPKRLGNFRQQHVEKGIPVTTVITFWAGSQNVQTFYVPLELLKDKPVKKTIDDFKSSEGFINLTLDNYRDFLSIVSLDRKYKRTIEAYFNSIDKGILPDINLFSSICQLDTKHRKKNVDPELLGLQLLVEVEEKCKIKLDVFTNKILNKLFMIYSEACKRSILKDITFTSACEILGIKNEKSREKFLRDIINSSNDVRVNTISSLGEKTREFKPFVGYLETSALSSLEALFNEEKPDEIKPDDTQLQIPSEQIELFSTLESFVFNTFTCRKETLSVSSSESSIVISGLDCPFLNDLGVDYKKRGIPSVHQVAINYTSTKGTPKGSRLHDTFHNFNMKHILPVILTYSDGTQTKRIIPVALCKLILGDIIQNGFSLYNLENESK